MQGKPWDQYRRNHHGLLCAWFSQLTYLRVSSNAAVPHSFACACPVFSKPMPCTPCGQPGKWQHQLYTLCHGKWFFLQRQLQSGLHSLGDQGLLQGWSAGNSQVQW